jgi:hypothetical protein
MPVAIGLSALIGPRYNAALTLERRFNFLLHYPMLISLFLMASFSLPAISLFSTCPAEAKRQASQPRRLRKPARQRSTCKRLEQIRQLVRKRHG